MYDAAKTFYDFLEEQRIQRETVHTEAKRVMDVRMTQYMRTHGWTRVIGVKTKYTKTFNGKPITIEFKCSLKDSYKSGGLPEFVHDRSIPSSMKLLMITHFIWNEQISGGHPLDTVMERMETFYDNYTK